MYEVGLCARGWGEAMLFGARACMLLPLLTLVLGGDRVEVVVVAVVVAPAALANAMSLVVRGGCERGDKAVGGGRLISWIICCRIAARAALRCSRSSALLILLGNCVCLTVCVFVCLFDCVVCLACHMLILTNEQFCQVYFYCVFLFVCACVRVGVYALYERILKRVQAFDDGNRTLRIRDTEKILLGFNLYWFQITWVSITVCVVSDSFTYTTHIHTHIHTTQEMDFDVVVVGAGIAGLGAARSLIDAGLRVQILEARNR